MARGQTVVFTNPFVFITTSTVGQSTGNGAQATIGFNVSEWFRQIQLDITADEKEDTTFGLTAKSRVQGLFDWSFEGEVLKDYLSSGVVSSTGTLAYGMDGLTYDLLSNKVKFNLFVRPSAAAVRSSDNPEYWGPVRLFTHRGVGGTAGDVLTAPVSFKGSGNFVRYTSAT